MAAPDPDAVAFELKERAIDDRIATTARGSIQPRIEAASRNHLTETNLPPVTGSIHHEGDWSAGGTHRSRSRRQKALYREAAGR